MDNSRYYNRTIVKETVASSTLSDARSIRVLIPPGYHELVSAPVVYCQDGEDFFNFGRIATHAVQLILDEGIEPFIVVGVDVDKTKRTAEYTPEGDLHQAYTTFFAEELLPFIESKWNVQREGRILAGDSLGATVSLHLALRYPNLFQRVISMSGAFLQTTADALSEQSDLSWLKLYSVIGTEETAVKTERGTFDFLAWNRHTRALLEQKAAKLTYQEKPGTHIWGFWQQEMPEALSYFLKK
ncbi:alpha/beta hydrolase [Paenibacillus turpanensis]|uniref:alpha/beta hydrolase n=1 Tax=Paenibacillus turpanensis TaxID=2689078 RepID=UPI0014072758|nr:alpha/beta hydrolase-fold protein [Paenibacillus turpanensis]